MGRGETKLAILGFRSCSDYGKLEFVRAVAQMASINLPTTTTDEGRAPTNDARRWLFGRTADTCRF